jgi:hypothetical protein
VPEELEGLVSAGGGGFMVRTKMAVPGPAAFVAVSMTLNVPDTEGVPEITPVAGFVTDRPAGNPLAANKFAPSLAVIE